MRSACSFILSPFPGPEDCVDGTIRACHREASTSIYAVTLAIAAIADVVRGEQQPASDNEDEDGEPVEPEVRRTEPAGCRLVNPETLIGEGGNPLL